MKIAVIGLWHLGSVTAACLSNAGHDVIAFDHNIETIKNFNNNITPVFEPGLEDLIAKAKLNDKLTFTSNLENINTAEIIWITLDTPVDDHDIANTQFVIEHIKNIYPYLQKNSIVIISSQLPVGTTRQLQEHYRQQFPDKPVSFVYSPENLRLGKAIEIFFKPDRIILGTDAEHIKTTLQTLLSSFTHKLIWMSVESAEMTKHAINAFLATSVTFINELAILCEKTGANAREVEQGLKSEERIGPKAYLRPGGAIAGGTLARDVNYLVQISKQQSTQTPLLSAILESNHAHKQWSCRKIGDILKNLQHKTIATLGLTYKPGTDTLRRSTAVETCLWLSKQGAKITAYDPSLTILPSELASIIHLKKTLKDAIQKVDAIIISVEHPEFNALDATMTDNAYIFDPSGFLSTQFQSYANYFCVGK